MSSLLRILSILLAWLDKYVLAEQARIRRENAELEKALAHTDVDTITRLLSERYDRVRDKNGDRAR